MITPWVNLRYDPRLRKDDRVAVTIQREKTGRNKITSLQYANNSETRTQNSSEGAVVQYPLVRPKADWGQEETNKERR